MESKMAEHDKEIEGLKEFRKSTVKRLESHDLKLDGISKQLQSLFIKLSKPLFTPVQLIGGISALIVYVVMILVYGGEIKSDVRVNTVEISNYKHLMEIQTLQFDKIQNTLDLIQIDVAVLKAESE
jgi:hypothetical protein